MDSRKLLLIELKKAAGLATPAELDAYENTPILTGNGLVTYRPADAAAWQKRWEDAVLAPNALTPDPGAIREPQAASPQTLPSA